MHAPVAIKIIFMGLVALVPKYGDNKTPGRNELTVLLPDADRHGYASDGCNLPQHFPFLAVEAEHCSVGPWNRPCPKWDDFLPLRRPVIQGGGTIDGVWMLRRQQVELSFKRPRWRKPAFWLNHPDLRIQTGWRMLAPRFPRNPPEAGSSAWVATPPVGKAVRPDCLVGADCAIAARLTLRDGVLSTCHLAQLTDASEPRGGGYPKVWPFRFAKLGGSKICRLFRSMLGGHAIADATSVEIPIVAKGAVLRIILRSLDRPEEFKIIRIVPKGRKPVRIWLGNVADPDAAHNHAACHSSDQDAHFETYYDLTGLTGGNDERGLADRPIPQRSGRAMYERKCETPSGGQMPCVAQKTEYDWMEEFQNTCPLLTWGVPPGYGPQNGDLSICGQYQGKPGG